MKQLLAAILMVLVASAASADVDLKIDDDQYIYILTSFKYEGLQGYQRIQIQYGDDFGHNLPSGWTTNLHDCSGTSDFDLDHIMYWIEHSKIGPSHTGTVRDELKNKKGKYQTYYRNNLNFGNYEMAKICYFELATQTSKGNLLLRKSKLIPFKYIGWSIFEQLNTYQQAKAIEAYVEEDLTIFTDAADLTNFESDEEGWLAIEEAIEELLGY